MTDVTITGAIIQCRDRKKNPYHKTSCNDAIINIPLVTLNTIKDNHFVEPKDRPEVLNKIFKNPCLRCDGYITLINRSGVPERYNDNFQKASYEIQSRMGLNITAQEYSTLEV